MPSFPPSVRIDPDVLEEEARDCYQAAIFYNIYPHEELKSLVYIRSSGEAEGVAKVSTRFVMTHVPGDLYVDEIVLNQIVGQCRLAPDAVLRERGLERGRVNPWTAQFYIGRDITHVVSSLVLVLKDVYTNDDTLTGRSIFNPRELEHLLNPFLEYEIATNVRPKRSAWRL